MLKERKQGEAFRADQAKDREGKQGKKVMGLKKVRRKGKFRDFII